MVPNEQAARQTLDRLRQAIQIDPGQRGLGRILGANLFTHGPEDFTEACLHLARTPKPEVAIVTGFHILAADAPETDGPFGAVKLAEILHAIGANVQLFSESACAGAMAHALRRLGLDAMIPVHVVRRPGEGELPPCPPGLTHLIAIERPGPSHTPDSLRQQAGTTAEQIERYVQTVPREEWDRYHNAKGLDVTAYHAPLHRWFDEPERTCTTIGIGDGGNEIGMGRVPWELIERNIPGGGRLACRVAADWTIVAGVSNWGGYALAAGIAWLRGLNDLARYFDAGQHRDLWADVLQSHRLVDAGSRECRLRVDGLTWEDYIRLFGFLVATLDRG